MLREVVVARKAQTSSATQVSSLNPVPPTRDHQVFTPVAHDVQDVAMQAVEALRGPAQSAASAIPARTFHQRSEHLSRIALHLHPEG